MEEVFITEIEYNNIKFKIYMVNGKIKVTTFEEVDKNLIAEVKKIAFDKNAILNSKKNKVILPMLLISTGLFIGSCSKEDLEKLRIKNDKEYETEFKEEISSEDFYPQYVIALDTNPYLSKEDKESFMNRYDYISQNINNMNLSEVLKTVHSIQINRYDYTSNANGTFEMKNDRPIINLYKNADANTLIHEEYHALKYNKYYWDNVYYYNDKFIGTDEFKELSKQEQKEILDSDNKYEINGNMLEEAHTSIITAQDPNCSEKINTPYSNEIYIYKIYENIFGKDNMEKIMVAPNSVTGFLNNLMDVGCTKEEAIAIVCRLDTFNRSNKCLDIQKGLTLTRYQICNDLAYVYNKKYNNIDNIYLKMTILAVLNNVNLKDLEEYKDNFNFSKLYNDLISQKISLNNYLEKEYIENYAIDYNVNNITIDYFSSKYPNIYIETINSDYIILKTDGKIITKQTAYAGKETAQYIYKLYMDYYQFAITQYGNDKDFANYFATLYANTILSADEKGELVTYSDLWKSDLQYDIDFKRLLISSNYERIIDYISEIKSKKQINTIKH